MRQHAQAIAQFADVVVLYANSDDFTGRSLIQFEFQKDNGIPTLYFYYKKRITGIGPLDRLVKLILYFACMFRGYRMVKRQFGKPDLLHAHVLLRTGLFAWYMRFSKGIPYVLTEHWTLYMPEDPNKVWLLRKWFSRIAVKRAEAVTTVSGNLRDAMQKLGFRNANYKVIPNVIDTALFSIPETARPVNSNVFFLHVSSLTDASKNVSGLLRTVAKLAKNTRNFELRIVGFDHDEAELKKLAQELGLLNTFVFFEGKKETPEVAAYFKQADVFVLPSRYETFGVVLIEALASGVPVIASAVGGVPEVVTQEHGILIPPDDENALLEAMEFMLRNHQNFPKQKLRDYAVNLYSYHAVGRQFATLYETVLETVKNREDVR